MDIRTYLQEREITQAEFAASLGVTQSMVGHWVSGRHRVTAERAAQIEHITGGAISRAELRPDVLWAVA